MTRKIRKLPTPRSTRFYGLHISAIECPNGTWIEPEEEAYPYGGFTRRAYAYCDDGRRRVVRCSIADASFFIPAAVRIRSRYVTGFITIDDDHGVLFHEYASSAR